MWLLSLLLVVVLLLYNDYNCYYNYKNEQSLYKYISLQNAVQ